MRFHQLHRLIPVLDPTKTTKTAAYVAVDTKASTLAGLTTNVSTAMNIITDTETVTRLFVVDGLIAMINIGPTRNEPPTAAMVKRQS